MNASFCQLPWVDENKQLGAFDILEGNNQVSQQLYYIIFYYIYIYMSFIIERHTAAEAAEAAAASGPAWLAARWPAAAAA